MNAPPPEQVPAAPWTPVGRGVMKRCIRAGSGEPPRLDGSVCDVRYVGYAEGSPEPFLDDQGSVELGGDVLEGWNVALRAMRPQEKAEFQIPADLGYGEQTMAGLPAHAALRFELELCSWQPGEDVLGDGSIFRYIVDAGDAPVEGADVEVTVNLDGEIHAWSLHTPPADMDARLVRAVGLMRRGEIAEFRCADQPDRSVELLGYSSTLPLQNPAFPSIAKRVLREGVGGAPCALTRVVLRVHPADCSGSAAAPRDSRRVDAVLDELEAEDALLHACAASLATGERARFFRAGAPLWEVELDELEHPPSPGDFAEEKEAQNAACALCEAGNALYRAGHVARAQARYEHALTLCEDLRAQRNLVACLLETGQYAKALRACNEAEDVGERSAQLYLRRARAKSALHNYDGAMSDLDRVASLHPTGSEKKKLARAREEVQRMQHALLRAMSPGSLGWCAREGQVAAKTTRMPTAAAPLLAQT